MQPQGVPFPLCLYNPAEQDVTNTAGRVGSLIMAGDTCEFTPSETWGYWSWNFGEQYHFSDNLMAYVKTNRTQRAGGHQFRDVSGEFPPFDEEVLTDFEAGIKTEWFDNRVRLNVAGFVSDYEDYQYTIQASTSIGTITTATVNFGDAEVRGAEADLVALVTADLSLHAGVGWAKIDYDEPDFQHFNMPEISAYVSLSYHPNLAFGDGLVQVNWSFRDETEKEVNQTVAARLARGPGSVIDSYQLLDARVGVTLDSGWEVHFWGRNLTKKKYYKDALNLNGAFMIGYVGEPRTYGLEVGYSW